MEEEFSHEQCREFTYELIQWIVARTMIGYTGPLSDRLSQWAIWYLPRHCSHCGACGDDAHITESGVCDACLINLTVSGNAHAEVCNRPMLDLSTMGRCSLIMLRQKWGNTVWGFEMTLLIDTRPTNVQMRMIDLCSGATWRSYHERKLL